MAGKEVEFKFTVELRKEKSPEHLAQATRKAREACIMELLRLGDMSAGRAAELLGINRTKMSELMYDYNISPLDETMTLEDIQRGSVWPRSFGEIQ